MSKCLVTGGAGFIGSHIIGKLMALGHDVICLDNFDDYYDISLKEKNISPFLNNPRFLLVRGSILNKKTVKKCMKGIDYVFHEAAQAGISESIKNPLNAHTINTTGTLNILESARNAGVKKVINASSSSVYGKALYYPLDEKHPALPISPYGVSKLCAENYCEVYRELYGLNTVSLRYFTVFGPRMRPDLAIAIFTDKALVGKDIDIFGDGSKSRDFTYIDNIVSANIAAMSHGSGIYNIGGAHGITIKELAEKIIGITKSHSVINFKDNAPGDMAHTLASTARATAELGYEPVVNIDDGLRRYVDYVRARSATGAGYKK
jgi:UDP-glucose 4-epimerase